MPLPIHKRGKYFEDLFARFARAQGFHVVKNDLSCRITYQGGIQLTNTELDYTLIGPGGKVGFFDVKECAQSRFAYSKMNHRQVERASNFNRWGVPAGFVVWFRTQNRVELVTGFQVGSVGPGCSIGSGSGLFLGKLEAFDIECLLNPVHYKLLLPQDELPFIPSQEEPSARSEPSEQSQPT